MAIFPQLASLLFLPQFFGKAPIRNDSTYFKCLLMLYECNFGCDPGSRRCLPNIGQSKWARGHSINLAFSRFLPFSLEKEEGERRSQRENKLAFVMLKCRELKFEIKVKKNKKTNACTKASQNTKERKR